MLQNLEQKTEEAGFEELKAEKKESPSKNEIDFILDVPLDLTVQLGMTKMLIRDLLQLGQGSVVELDKLAGEPMEILINNKLVARGEVVVVTLVGVVGATCPPVMP